MLDLSMKQEALQMLLSLESLIPKHFQKKVLMSSPEFTIIDRRDFIRQIEQLLLRDGSDPIPDTFFATKERRTPLGPTFFNAARSL